MKDGWSVKKLVEVCEINYGTRVVQKKDGGTIYPVYGGGGATFKMDIYNREDCLVVSRFAMSSQCVRYVRGKFFLNDSGLTVKTDSVCLSQEYLDKCILSLNDKIYSLGKGVAQKNLDMKEFRNLNIHYPISLPEQSRIVEELDLLSNIIEKKRQQLSELDNLAQSIFYDMFGDPVTNEKGWEVKKYREFGKVIGGYAFVSDLFTDDGIPVLKIGNINSGNLKVDKLCFYKYDENLLNYLVYPNDIVISLTGTVGKDDYGNVCVLPDLYNVYYLNQRNAKLDTKGVCENLFLKFLFADYKIKAELTKNSRGVRQANISNNDIYNLSLPLPPLSLQQFFARKIEAIEKQKALIKQSIAETEELFNSRMDYYFS